MSFFVVSRIISGAIHERQKTARLYGEIDKDKNYFKKQMRREMTL
jgi:hypothetical protein